MASIVDVTEDTESIAKFLQSYIQSGNINFLIGSGGLPPEKWSFLK